MCGIHEELLEGPFSGLIWIKSNLIQNRTACMIFNHTKIKSLPYNHLPCTYVLTWLAFELQIICILYSDLYHQEDSGNKVMLVVLRGCAKAKWCFELEANSSDKNMIKTTTVKCRFYTFWHLLISTKYWAEVDGMRLKKLAINQIPGKAAAISLRWLIMPR